MANIKKKKRQKRLWVTDEVTRELKQEFNASNQVVLNALKFSSYSEQAQLIRVKAIELMKAVDESNKELFEDFQN